MKEAKDTQPFSHSGKDVGKYAQHVCRFDRDGGMQLST